MPIARDFTVVQPFYEVFGAAEEKSGDTKVIDPPILTLNDATNLTPAECPSDDEDGKSLQLGNLKKPINITYNGAHYHHPIGAVVKFQANSAERIARVIAFPKIGKAPSILVDGGRRTHRKKGRNNQQRRQNRKSQKSRK